MKKTIVAAALTLAVYSTAANASVVLPAQAGTGEMSTPGMKTYMFNAGASSGIIDFILDGYNTLDGNTNGDPSYAQYEDTLHLFLNGSEILTGRYALGGVGVSTTDLAPSGASVAAISNGYSLGGTATFSLSGMLNQGLNTLTFSYTGLAQSTADEGWGLRNVTVQGASFAGAVPETATWAMMIVGFGVAGAMLRRRARQAVRVTFA